MNTKFLLALALISMCLCLGFESTSAAAALTFKGRNLDASPAEAGNAIGEHTAEKDQLEAQKDDNDELANAELGAADSQDQSQLEIASVDENYDVTPVHGNLRARRQGRRGRRGGKKSRKGGKKNRRTRKGGKKSRKGGKKSRKGRKNRKAGRKTRRTHKKRRVIRKRN